MDKISIIIPAYNSSKYIDECLLSVVNQEYTNLEILIINDGSTDDTKDYIEKWSKLDKRIKVFNKKNSGVSETRNYGIKKSIGKYLVFVDSDDIIKKDFVNNLYTAIIEDNSDCSICGIKGFFKIIDEKQEFLEKKSYTVDESKKNLFTLYGGYLANKMYKSEIIKTNKLSLNKEIHICEDLLFNLQYFNYCNKVSYNSMVSYYYRQYSSSSFNDINNEKWFSILDTYNHILKSENLTKNIDKNLIIYYYLLILIEAKYRARKQNNNQFSKLVRSEIKKYFRLEYLKKMNLKQIAKIVIFKIGYPIIAVYKRKLRSE